MNKNLKLLYFSATENTKQFIRTIAGAISEDYKEYDITAAKKRKEIPNFNENDLLIVGSPVYGGRIPELLTEYFKKVKGANTPAAFVVSYGNRDYDDALLELKDIFEDNDFIGIAAGAFVGEHSNSKEIAGERPDQSDFKSAEDFGRQIKRKVEATAELKSYAELEVRGDYPYKERHESPDFAPKTADSCIECAVCAENCPVSAISFDNFSDINESKCISCCSCIQKCPVDAKSMDHPHFKEVTDYLIENFSDQRKEAEIFI